MAGTTNWASSSDSSSSFCAFRLPWALPAAPPHPITTSTPGAAIQPRARLGVAVADARPRQPGFAQRGRSCVPRRWSDVHRDARVRRGRHRNRAIPDRRVVVRLWPRDHCRRPVVGRGSVQHGRHHHLEHRHRRRRTNLEWQRRHRVLRGSARRREARSESASTMSASAVSASRGSSSDRGTVRRASATSRSPAFSRMTTPLRVLRPTRQCRTCTRTCMSAIRGPTTTPACLGCRRTPATASCSAM